MKLLSIFLLLSLSLGTSLAVLNSHIGAGEALGTRHEERLQAASTSSVGYQYQGPSAQQYAPQQTDSVYQYQNQYQAPASANQATSQDHGPLSGGYFTARPDLQQAETPNYGNGYNSDRFATPVQAAAAIQEVLFQAQRYTQARPESSAQHAAYLYQREPQEQQHFAQYIQHQPPQQHQPLQQEHQYQQFHPNQQQQQFQPQQPHQQQQEAPQQHFQNAGYDHFETQAPRAPLAAGSQPNYNYNSQSSFPYAHHQQSGGGIASSYVHGAVFRPDQQFPAPAFDHAAPAPAAGGFAAPPAALPAATYLPAHFAAGPAAGAVPAVSSTTSAAPPVYATGQKGLGHYAYRVHRPVALEVKQGPSTAPLLTGEQAHKAQSGRGGGDSNGFEYLQMQSDSYELPSYFTTHSDPAASAQAGPQQEQPHQQQQQAPQQQQREQPAYSSYVPPTQAQSEYSYAAPGYPPQSLYGAGPQAAGYKVPDLLSHY